MGSELYVESTVGSGSTFSFQIAARVSDNKGRMEALNKSNTASEFVSVGNKRAARPIRCLVAEDNRINQKVIIRLLEKHGISTDLAENGDEAVKMAQQNEYDLILMDMQMPIKDGITATEEIRRLPIRQPIIVALTANAFAEDREKCFAAGMSDFLSKPISREDLDRVLAKCASS